MSKYMEPKQFLVDSCIFRQGDKATDMLFLATGEVNLTVDVWEMEEHGKVKHTLDLGRVGPGTVLGDYLCSPDSFLQDCPYRESCESSTFVTAFAIAKYDLFFRIPKDIQARIKTQVRYVGPSKTGLFQNTIKQIDPKEFRKSLTWKSFRKDYVQRGRKVSILENFAHTQGLKLEEGAGNYRSLPPSPREIMANKMKALSSDPLPREVGTAESEYETGPAGRRQKKKKKPKQLPGFTSMHTKKKTVNGLSLNQLNPKFLLYPLPNLLSLNTL